MLQCSYRCPHGGFFFWRLNVKNLVIVAALVLASAHVAAENCYSEGVRVGTVQKFSAKGLVNKSWEGELVMDGVKMRGGYKTGTSGGNVWRFSALDAAVAKAIDDAVMTGGEVALKYCEITPLDVTRRLTVQTPYIITKAVARSSTGGEK